MSKKKRDETEEDDPNGLRARAIASRGSADAARAEAGRLQSAAERLQLEAEKKVEEANAAAAEAAAEALQQDIQVAQDIYDQKMALYAEAQAAADEARGIETAAKEEADDAARELAKLTTSVAPSNVASVRLEDGGFVEVVPPVGPRDRRVLGTNNVNYDHVSEDEHGAWLYRAHR